MLKWFLAAALLAMLADEYSTWLCLSMPPVPGIVIYEANPFALLLFNKLGVTYGILLDIVIRIVPTLLLVWLKVVPDKIYCIALGLATLLTAAAAVNNFVIYFQLS